MSSTQEPISEAVETSSSSSGLESLSPEILLTIIKQLQELISLDSLIRASPSSFRVFSSYGVEITDAILDSGYIQRHIRTMIRVTAIIRTSKLPMDNVWDFLKRTTFPAMRERMRLLKCYMSPPYLEADTPPAILRGILASNRHIANLSLDFLNVHLERFRALRPRRLDDESQIPAGTETPAPRYLTQNVKMEQYDVQDIGPPNWKEEQRVIRLFWRIQMLYDMKRAGANGLLKWPAKELDYLNEMSLREFYRATKTGSWHSTQAHPEYYLMTSVEEYLMEVYPSADLWDISNMAWLVPPHPIKEVQKEGRILIPENLLYTSKPHGWHPLISASTVTSFWYSEMRWIEGEVPFEAFGKWGFAFWCKARLRGYGLLPDTLKPLQHGAVDYRPYTYRWLSLLDDQDST